MFFVYEGLWQKFFGAFGAWIHRPSLICGFLKFLKAFEPDSSELWDLGTWFRWFFFECSSYLKVCGESSSGLWRLEFIKFHQFVVSGGFWAWFHWPLRSREMIWIISLRMFIVFEVEVLEVPRGFKAWFQQSFCTFQSSLMLLVL